MQHPAERDRRDEEVDDEHVQREQPDRGLHVVHVHVLDDRDLELPGQEHDREHREERRRVERRQDARVRVARAPDDEQLLDAGQRPGAREHVPEPVEDSVGHERAHREERDELHERLEGDRRDHPLVPLGGVEVARPEDDGERGEDERHVEGGVAEEGAVARAREDLHVVRVDDLEGGGDRLELQRDVRKDPDHRDHGDEPRDERALPVPRRDEVRERGDPVDLADEDHLPEQDPPEQRT